VAKSNSTKVKGREKETDSLPCIKFQIEPGLHRRFRVVLAMDGVSIKDSLTEMIAKHVAKREAAAQ